MNLLYIGTHPPSHKGKDTAPPSIKRSSIMDSKTYDELHGINNWDGLLEPLDPALRKLLLDYGDLALAAELAFIGDDDTLYTGYSRYGMKSFFKGVMLPWADSRYEVVSFLYATARIDFLLAILFHAMSREGGQYESNWMGYIAVSNDKYSKAIGRREIVVVWRGSSRTYEWIEDFLASSPVPAHPVVPQATDGAKQAEQVQDGLLTIYTTCDKDSEFVKTSARTQLLEKIKELLIKYKDEKISITCTGHSLGACLSVLSAADLASNVVTPDVNVSAFIFESPQVGNEAFKSKLDELPNLKILRVLNEPDSIPLWPSKQLKIIKDIGIWLPTGLLEYVDVGIELLIDSRKSSYVKADMTVYHLLPVVLHTLGGWKGKNGEFDLSLSNRSLGWVNIQGSALNKEYKIPGAWWAEKNKGMVLTDNGEWVLAPIDHKDHGILHK